MRMQYMGSARAATTASSTTLHLVEVARSVSVLAPSTALSPQDRATVLAWFSSYTDWPTNSVRGHEERNMKNNHSTTWLLQAAEFATLTGKTAAV
jgi:hypothetical protein